MKARCPKSESWLDFADAAEEGEAAALEHLEQCSQCSQRFSIEARLRAQLRRLPVLEPPSSLTPEDALSRVDSTPSPHFERLLSSVLKQEESGGEADEHLESIWQGALAQARAVRVRESGRPQESGSSKILRASRVRTSSSRLISWPNSARRLAAAAVLLLGVGAALWISQSGDDAANRESRKTLGDRGVRVTSFDLDYSVSKPKSPAFQDLFSAFAAERGGF